MARVLIMASDGFEQSELFVPLETLKAAGHEVAVAAPETGEIRAWGKDGWGKAVQATATIGAAEAGAHDALVLPGGVINPDTLRQDEKAIGLIRGFAEAGKPVAAICHAPWLLVEAGLAQGRRMTGYGSIRTDLRNAGAEVVDEAVVADRGVITSRDPGDLKAFVGAIEEALA
ncbi:type 1 glutamine amidotransferase domain-containing protein [Paracoccus spongiarum]|uniref:Type 1 glutamine amidotransferase domain-containing protein n=1 Tax=Paracoccus spongiarum TaxID=3064387 RepID=A0ABT9JCW7_9RHOB|nr:type 1 glutamine amidotransferase domain-containing protein [Paracoccus sp. 2205BS29-5]MDP5307658.1 type 1 glutamine amidotransferase domain-containing protein [Paracoccus sp. 2205BS29-5]